MARVLHLLSVDADFETRRTQTLLCGQAGRSFDCQKKTIGIGGDLRNMATAVLEIRRFPADVLHAWGTAALTAAALAGARRIIFNPTGWLNPRELSWLRAILAFRNVQTICATAWQHRAAMENGIPPARCHLIRPGVEFGRIGRRGGGDLRAALDLHGDDFVLLAAGESTRLAGHELGVWTVGILNVLNPRYKIVLWGRGHRASQITEHVQRLRQAEMIRTAESKLGRSVEFEDLLEVASAILITAAPRSTTLPIAICMASGKPIVSVTNHTTAELLEDRHTALMTTHPTPRQLAQRILDLQADSAVGWSIADMARTEAYEYFSATRLLEQYRSVYRQMAEDRAIEIPTPAAGAGVRFHGLPAAR